MLVQDQDPGATVACLVVNGLKRSQHIISGLTLGCLSPPKPSTTCATLPTLSSIKAATAKRTHHTDHLNESVTETEFATTGQGLRVRLLRYISAFHHPDFIFFAQSQAQHGASPDPALKPSLNLTQTHYCPLLVVRCPCSRP